MDAHIKALLRNKDGGRSKNETRTYPIGDYVLDAAHAKLKLPDQTINVLTSRESEILELLCKNREEIVRRDAILSQFWKTDDKYFASRSLDVFITKLRKLFADSLDIQIQNIRTVGLMLHVEPH